VTRRWAVNYVAAFEKNAYSLIAMKPEILPGGGERALRYLADPFNDDMPAAVSEVFRYRKARSRVASLLDLYVCDFVKVVIRTRMIERLNGAAVLSVADRKARQEYGRVIDALKDERSRELCNRLVKTFERLWPEDGASVNEEIPRPVWIPEDPDEELPWAMSILADSEMYEEEHAAKLGAACRCIENELLRRARMWPVAVRIGVILAAFRKWWRKIRHIGDHGRVIARKNRSMRR